MEKNDIAIKVENVGKRYRIGAKEERRETLGATVVDMLTSPLKNYRNYRALYNFDDSQGSAEDSGILWALRDVSFDVMQGQVVGIIGANGAGKSTLLKVLSRITMPTTGRVEIRGRVSSLLEVGTGFHPELTGRENIYLNGTILGMRKREVDQRFEQIVEFSGVQKFLDTPVKRYSSGMRVRLAFSVAAHLEPEILIIDEVLAVGDAAFQRKCLDKMQDVGRQGRTVLFVSHNMPAVTRLCERAVLLEGGTIVEDGSADHVVSRYLGAGLGASAELEWQDPGNAPGGEIVKLRAVRLRDESGNVSSVFDVTQPMALEMEYEVLKPGFNLLPHYHVHNDEGLKLFVSLDLDPKWKGKARPVGRYVSTALVPGNLFAEGQLLITPALSTVNPDNLEFYARDVVGCNVVDSGIGESARGDYMQKLKGAIRPKLEWRTDFSPVNSNTAVAVKQNR